MDLIIRVCKRAPVPLMGLAALRPGSTEQTMNGPFMAMSRRRSYRVYALVLVLPATFRKLPTRFLGNADGPAQWLTVQVSQSSL